MDNEVKVKCKRCARIDYMHKFVLDPVYKMVVCPGCVQERKDKEAKIEKDREMAAAGKAEALAKPKPAGWDAEDDFLSRSGGKKEQAVAVQKLADGRVRYKCPKCSYQFAYDTELKKPRVCPYCSSEIAKIAVKF